MNNFEIFAIAWIPFCVVLVIAFAFSLGWFEDRAARRNARHPAE